MNNPMQNPGGDTPGFCIKYLFQVFHKTVFIYKKLSLHVNKLNFDLMCSQWWESNPRPIHYE